MSCGARLRLRYCFLFLLLLPCAWLAGGAGSGCVRFNHHCCATPTRPLVRIYTARPLGYGITTNIAAMPTGMNFIIACCCGSVAVIGVILEARYMESPIRIGSTKQGSFAERSLIHPNQGACRISIVPCSARYNPNQIGICNSCGMQPPTGLMPSRLYTAITSLFISCLRGSRIEYFLYFSWICLISGATRCIFNEVLYPEYFSGNKSMLMISVRTTMAQPQLGIYLCSHFSA